MVQVAQHYKATKGVRCGTSVPLLIWAQMMVGQNLAPAMHCREVDYRWTTKYEILKLKKKCLCFLKLNLYIFMGVHRQSTSGQCVPIVIPVWADNSGYRGGGGGALRILLRPQHLAVLQFIFLLRITYSVIKEQFLSYHAYMVWETSQSVKV